MKVAVYVEVVEALGCRSPRRWLISTHFTAGSSARERAGRRLLLKRGSWARWKACRPAPQCLGSDLCRRAPQ